MFVKSCLSRFSSGKRRPLSQSGLTLCPNFIGLQKDLISSLRSRLDLLCDEAERSVEDDQCSSSNEMENSVAKSNTSSQFLRPKYAHKFTVC